MIRLSVTQVEAVSSTATPPAAADRRVYSVDAFRGFTMIWLVSQGFGFLAFRNDPVLGRVAAQFTHYPWHGMNAWDLIQPFFIFIVGMAMPFSFRRRWEAHEPWTHSLLHVLRRSVLLFVFSAFERSIQTGKLLFDPMNVLSQIAAAYPFAFLILRKNWKFQTFTALGFLLLPWAVSQFGVAPGVTGPWDKDANMGWYLDGVVWHTNYGSYATINFVGSISTIIFGILASELLMSGLPAMRKMRSLALGGVGAIATGLALDPVIPIIKRLWTPSFVLLSGGCTLLVLLAFYWLCDVRKFRKWAAVLVVVGSNSIFVYVFHEILWGWLTRTGLVFTGWAVKLWGPWGQMLNADLVILFQIYVCYWLYRRKIFFKI